jgi:hypothetical protein
MARPKQYFRWQIDRFLRPSRRAVLRHLYKDNNRRMEDSILVAGTARSGTTWLGDLLAGTDGRVLFEPFHPGKISALKYLSYFPYLRPGEENPQLKSYCQQVFSGAVRHPWVDREVAQLHPTFRVIKEIRANLFLKWLYVQFPQVPQLLIVRHPCAVVLSRLQLRWATDTDILSFLNQQALIDDHLAPYLEIMGRAQTDVEKHAIIWCVSHLVPLRQFDPQDLTTVFYEDLCVQPQIELPRIENVVKRPFPAGTLTLLSRPSSTTIASSAILTGDNRIAHWQKSLSASEIRQILDIVAAFGLDYLYGDGLLPRCTHTGDTHVGLS